MKNSLIMCPRCHYLGRNNESACPYCGGNMISNCPHCGAPVRSPFAKYCFICGKMLFCMNGENAQEPGGKRDA